MIDKGQLWSYLDHNNWSITINKNSSDRLIDPSLPLNTNNQQLTTIYPGLSVLMVVINPGLISINRNAIPYFGRTLPRFPQLMRRDSATVVNVMSCSVELVHSNDIYQRCRDTSTHELQPLRGFQDSCSSDFDPKNLEVPKCYCRSTQWDALPLGRVAFSSVQISSVLMPISTSSSPGRGDGCYPQG